MSNNLILTKAVERLKTYHPDVWAAKGIIAKAKTGYICPNPNCRNGSGHDGTGATAKAGTNGWQVLCPVCNDGYDIIDTLGFYFNLSPQTQFIDIVKRGCPMFGVDIETGDADYSPDYKPAEQKIDYDRIKRTITDARKNLGDFHAKFGNPYRGIYRATFEDFGCGYDPHWYARKDAPRTPRLIIPSSWEHYLARLIGKIEDFNVPDGVHLDAKEHRGSKGLFNFNRALKTSEDPICFIVEGELDAMSIAQVTAKPAANNKTAYPINVVAIAGSTLTPLMEKQLQTITQKNFIVMLDNDDAGIKAAPILVAKLKSFGHRALDILVSKTYNDANDFLQSDSRGLKERIKELYSGAKELFDGMADYEKRNASKAANRTESSQPSFNTPPGCKLGANGVQMPKPRKYEGKEYYGTDDIAKIIGVTRQTVSWWHNKGLFTADERAHDGRYLYDVERVLQLAAVYRPNWQKGSYDPTNPLDDAPASPYPDDFAVEGIEGNTTTISTSFATPPSTNSTCANPDKYAPLFEGLEPVRVSAGAILQVADSDTKSYLETLFVEKNFILFVNNLAPREDCTTQENPPDLVYSSLDAVPTSNLQNEKALTWLVRAIAPYYHNNFKAMRRMLCERMKAAKSQAGMSYFQDMKFINKALDGVTVEPYYFEDKFKRELIAFADHSDEVFLSLIRFDYPRTSKFLQKTLTDVTCAELLVDVQHAFMRFDVDQATWYWWNTNHWQAVLAKTNSHLYELWTPLARKSRVFAAYQHFKITCDAEDFAICNTILDSNLPASDKKKRLDRAVKSAASKVKETNKLEASRSIESLLEQASGLPEIKIHTNQLDQNPYLFNSANCTIDLQTMETFPARREDLITLATDTIYDPTATCPDWDNFIRQAIPDNALRDWFQRFIGYCMSGLTVEQIFVFVYGVGGSGKSTCLNAIAGVFGDYAKVFPPELITENAKQKDGNEPNPIVASWRNARLIRSDETKKNKRLDEAAIKRYSGSDRLVARELHKTPFEYDPYFKIIIDGNHALSINDVHDQSLRRRLRIVPFNNPPAPEYIDVMLAKKLSTPQARSAILNWGLRGWIMYQERGLSDIPTAMKRAHDEFYNENDTIAEFLEDCGCEIGDKDRAKFQVAVMAVWRHFNEWRKANPHTPSYKKQEFVNAVLQSLKDDGVEVRDIAHQKHFVGFTINFDADHDKK